MARRKVDHSHGGAEMEKINALHFALIDAATKALQNEIESGEIRPATLTAIRQICSDAGVVPTRSASEAMERLMTTLPKLDFEAVGRSYSR
jgi:hypothetical protein